MILNDEDKNLLWPLVQQRIQNPVSISTVPPYKPDDHLIDRYKELLARIEGKEPEHQKVLFKTVDHEDLLYLRILLNNLQEAKYHTDKAWEKLQFKSLKQYGLDLDQTLSIIAQQYEKMESKLLEIFPQTDPECIIDPLE
ncbi:hypothetical protein [Paenibacillus sp. Y412MC10]|uniref:hypothetical protein n=1 Tax=Geobacillus sp. (strain Y412MC10) TaxID=481743 RepID=UPI0011A1166C|nr:hypothetical protein [Paenibacillus sp. Y412MC10]